MALRLTAHRVSRPRLVGGVVVVVVLGVVGLQRLFAQPGYEMALAAGLLCPSVAALVTALELRRRPRGGAASLGRALENGLALALLAYLVAVAHGLRTGLCDLYAGTVLFALGPTVGTVLGAVWGALASELGRLPSRGRGVATVSLALAGPLGSAAFNLWLFYATPMVFSFDPFVGLFNGALYDTVVSESGLFSYRAASACSLFACHVASQQLERRSEGGRLRWRWPRRMGMVLLGAGAALGSLLSVAFGDALGHWQTASTIRTELGAELSVGHCRVIHDARFEAGRARRLAADCDAQVRAISRWLDGAPPAEPVNVFLFLDPGQKRHFMGAARTSIAKPWRAEIYLHAQAYPHPVLGHELVHVLAGAHGRGPFRIAGALGGLLPNPGLIEGIAEAAAPDDDNLSGNEWAAAMRRIEVLPPVRSLFALSFFGRHAATSYTAAGSFVEHVRHSHGIEVVKRWYGGEDITALTGMGWTELEQAWWARLDALTLDEGALTTARARFDRPGIFARRCPHVVDERLGWAAGRVGTGDVAGALGAYRRVLALDPTNAQAHLGVARCQDRAGEGEVAVTRYLALANDERMAAAARMWALETLGDLRLRAGDAVGARTHYDRLRPQLVDEGRLRTVDIKYHYADQPQARTALVALLIGSEPSGPSHDEALDRIGRWRQAEPDDGTPDYLFARQHINNHDHALAAHSLDAALGRELPVARAKSEALRLRIVAACALGDGATAKAMLLRYRNHPLVRPARAAAASRLVERCRGND